MSTKEKTCAERIGAELANREQYLADLIKKAEESEYYGDYEEIYELALSVDTKRVTKICLSWGGPADYLEVTWDNNGIEEVIYRFSDWFDTATQEVKEGSALWQYAEMMIEGEAARNE